MSDPKNIIHENLKKLEIMKLVLRELSTITRSTIRHLSWYNRSISGTMRDLEFAGTIYGSLSDRDIDSIPATVFPIFVRPLEKLVSLGSDFEEIKENIASLHDKTIDLTGPVGSSTSLVTIATGGTAANIVSLGDTVTFASIDVNHLMKEYLSHKDVDTEIDYIRKQLPKIIPDISTDFSHFLENYYASEPSAVKFQELIGCRSLIFFRLVYPVAEQYGVSKPVHTRRQQIAKFVYGRTSDTEPTAEKIIDAAKDLWDELSDQDPSGYSVKTGNVTPEYVEIVFNKVVITFSTLLHQRELVFVP